MANAKRQARKAARQAKRAERKAERKERRANRKEQRQQARDNRKQMRVDRKNARTERRQLRQEMKTQRVEARQDAGGVEVVEELAAEFEVELAAEARDALAYPLRLEPDVFVVIKTCLAHIFTPPYL